MVDNPKKKKINNTISPEEMDRFIIEATVKLEEKIKNLEKRRILLEEESTKKKKEIEKKAEDLEESRKALLNILEDVEESRKSAEDEKNKTEAIINNFADGILVFDKGNKLTLINPEAEKLFDVKGRDVIGRAIYDLSTFPTLRLMAEALGEKDEKVFRKEISFKRRKETESEIELSLEITTLPVMQKEEKIGVLVIVHDISREKLIERMKTEFVSLAAHQLRTPLSAIKWSLKMMLEGDMGTVNEDQRGFLMKTYESNERMISLINDLLDVTRIEEGRYLYDLSFSDLKEVVVSSIKSLEEEFKRRGINLIFNDLKEEIPKIKMDAEKIKLVIQNFLDNALKYTKSGGQVEVALRNNNNGVEVSVKDSGVGIPSDQQSRVFTKFFRAENVMRMDTEGSGLGLFITKNIVEAHEGKIWFESKEGAGSTFYMSLPAKKPLEGFLGKF